MAKVDFFTPVTYQNFQKPSNGSSLERVDDYFYLGGKKANVIQGLTKSGKERAILLDASSSGLLNIAKVISYFTVIIPLIMLVLKVALRTQHTFKVIDPKQKLEKGINFPDVINSTHSEKIAIKLQQLIPKIIEKEDDEAIEWLGKGNNLIFRFKEQPNLVFKMAHPQIAVYRNGKTLDSEGIRDERFNNMIEAKKVCLINDLGLLIIPRAKKVDVVIDGKRYCLIAEETLDLDFNESAHEELYHKYSSELNDTARQLALFIAKTGFNDVTWRNIPILNEKVGFTGPRRVGLIDLEHMSSVVNGLIGDCFNGSYGLINCVSEKQIDIIIEEAEKQKVELSKEQVKKAKTKRLEKLDENKRLRDFYSKNGVVTGKEPIQNVDLESLGLNLAEEYKFNQIVGVDENGQIKREKVTVTLRDATEQIIAEINQLIQGKPENASAKGKRYLLLNTNKGIFGRFNRTGWSDREEKTCWLSNIIEALVNKGHLFKLDKINGHGYFIQA